MNSEITKLDTKELLKKAVEIIPSKKEIEGTQVGKYLPTTEVRGTEILPFQPYNEVKNELFATGKKYFDDEDAHGLAMYAVDLRNLAVYGHTEFNERLDKDGKPMRYKYFDVVYEGGVSPSYLSMVDNFAEYKHDARFWFMLAEAISNGEKNPVWNYHADYIEKYSNLLPMEESIKYLFGMRALLLEKKDDLPDEGRANVLERVKQMIVNKREIVQTATELSGLRKLLRENEDAERTKDGDRKGEGKVSG